MIKIADTSFKFQKESFTKTVKITMTSNDKIGDGKLEYNVNRESAKISPLSWGKTDKYEYLPSQEILPSEGSRITDQAKFIYSPLTKALKNKQKRFRTKGKNK